MERIYFGTSKQFCLTPFDKEYCGELVSAVFDGCGPSQKFEISIRETVLLNVVTSDAIYSNIILTAGERVVATPSECVVMRAGGIATIVPRSNGGGACDFNTERAHIEFDSYEPEPPFVVTTHHDEEAGCVVFFPHPNRPCLHGRTDFETTLPWREVERSWLKTAFEGVMKSPLPHSVEVRLYTGDQILNKDSYKEFL